MALDREGLDVEFQSLVQNVLVEHCPNRGFGFMTTSVYDTAWVACVRAPDGSQLFPESFQAVLDLQDEQGAWPGSLDLTSRLLDSLAGLYALVYHSKNFGSVQVEGRISRAQQQLQHWLQDFTDIEQGGVGFELIAPCLLNLLAKEDVVFDFPAKAKLLELRRIKLAKIPVKVVYNMGTPLLHSLEAFFDDPTIDYDRFAKHKVHGSMMASPSSTAAYLMRSTNWDQEAEDYLRRTFSHGSGKGSGTFPSAFPSTIFETTWMLSTTLSSGFSYDLIPQQCQDTFRNIYVESGASEGRCVAFAPGLEADLDDTARMSISAGLAGLGQITSGMIAKFEARSHMETYKLERNPSFSANCNALTALLTEPPCIVMSLRSTIEKVVRFLYGMWTETSTLPTDKWNISPHYAPMLMSESFMKLVQVSEELQQDFLPRELFQEQIPQALTQYAIRTLQAQNANGSWGDKGPREETAYAVLGLAHISGYSPLEPLSNEIESAISRGRKFLHSGSLTGPPERLWVEKVLYGSQVLASTYILSALKIDVKKSTAPQHNGAAASEKEQKIAKLFAKLPMLQNCPKWLLKASRIEAQTYMPALECIRGRVFTREGFTDDEYLRWIPLIWTVANNSLGGRIAPTVMKEMMAISVINFQVDEFMESIVASEYADQFLEIASWVSSQLFGEPEDQCSMGPAGKKPKIKAEDLSICEVDKSNLPTKDRVRGPLSAFIQYVQSQPKVQQASRGDRNRLFSELLRFLTAHLTQNEDNRSISRQRKKRKFDEISESGYRIEIFRDAQEDFQSWVRGTAAEHTSALYSFAYFGCICGRGGQDFLSSTRQKYIAKDLSKHLAAMCRIYNDAGSLQRDQDECNLNSANFPELHFDSDVDVPPTERSAIYRDRLLAIASYERALLNTAYGELESISGPEVMDPIQVFIRVTDMFGEIYVLKDLASRNLTKAHDGNDHSI